MRSWARQKAARRRVERRRPLYDHKSCQMNGGDVHDLLHCTILHALRRVAVEQVVLALRKEGLPLERPAGVTSDDAGRRGEKALATLKTDTAATDTQCGITCATCYVCHFTLARCNPVLSCQCCGQWSHPCLCAPFFTCAGDHGAHCLTLRSDAEASPLFPSLRERQCAPPRTLFFRPPRVSTTVRSRARLSPPGSYESTFLRASYPCGIKNSPRVCQPLRVCRLWIDSTIKHLVHTLCQVVWGCLKGNFIVSESSSELRPPLHLVRSAPMHFAYLGFLAACMRFGIHP